MKLKLIFLLLILTTLNSYGQKEANTWYFGSDGAGLDFNNGCIPTILTDGKINGFEGCAAISDKTTGQFLFSTNSEWVWNRNQDTIPNSHFVTGGNTITQVMIIQKPTNNSFYYIITCDVQGYLGLGYRFHGVNMTMNGGLGGIAFKDSLLYLSPVTEKITAVRHANGTDIWLIGHEYNSNKFLSFLITSSGIATTPIISQIGGIYFSNGGEDAIGELKVSPDGSKIAAVACYHPNIELFDFNNSTGQISNLITLYENGAYDSITDFPSRLYGLSFSPNNSKLYASEIAVPSVNNAGKIIQYDISSNNSIIINNSKVNVFTSNNISIYGLKLAPNGKIYTGHQETEATGGYVGAINFPDNAGVGCNYVDTAIYLNGKSSGWGLNNLMEYANYCLPYVGINENAGEIKIKIYPNPAQQSFTIELPQQQNFNLVVVDVTGRKMYQRTNTTGTVSIDCSNFSSGVYFIKAINERTVLTDKLIKQ